MSFDLVVVAAQPGADEAAARALVDACYRPVHADGDLDERIVAFYEELRALFPDYPPYDPDSPWASAPLGTGVDHVFMNIRFSTDNEVVDAIQRLAVRHGLTLYDPQGDDIYLP
jgi:hypothetical protein